MSEVQCAHLVISWKLGPSREERAELFEEAGNVLEQNALECM